MEVTCYQCGTVFEATRSTARFCSDKCRVNAARAVADKEVFEQLGSVTEATEPATDNPPVTLKRECKRDENCCAECVDFPSGVHWCGVKTCKCWESPLEQRAYLERFQASCPHPEAEAYMSRCLKCGRVAFTHEEKESNYKGSRKKHENPA